MADKLTKDEALSFLKEFAASYESSSPKFFDNFKKDASFFVVSVPTRIDGVEQYRAGFEREFTGGKERRSQVMSPEVQLLGDETAAAITFHNRIHVNDVTTNNRVSLIVEKRGGRLEVSHLHVSFLGAPEVVAGAAAAGNISILEERVATAIGAVGTPK